MSLKLEESIDALNSNQGVGLRKKPRKYIGASSIGNDCDAYLALSLRGFPDNKPAPKTQRIFDTGTVLEDVIIEAMREAGLVVIDRDEMTGKQFHFEAYNGHVQCNMDGIIECEERMVLEIKTMNQSKWNAFKKHGVRKSHPMYLAQVQACMALSKLEKAVIVAMNKNTQELAYEIIDFDVIEWSYMKSRVEAIMSGRVERKMPERSNWICDYCFKNTSCWEPESIEAKHCSMCKYSAPSTLGDHKSWYCNKHDRDAEGVCDQYVVFEPDIKLPIF